MITSAFGSSWLPVVAALCTAVVPGPCAYMPDPAYDCSAGDPCGTNLACVIVDDVSGRGFCRSADTACDDGTTLCKVPGLDRSGICVDDDDFAVSSAHCGGCFQRCRGGASCVDGVCADEIDDGACVIARGNFDCEGGEGCVEGVCVDGANGDGGVLDACDDGGDCDGGLCVAGVCTRPCDFGCPPTTTCDEDAIPGGLCVPVDDDGCFE